LPLISRLEEAPGVKSVSAISLPPLSSDRNVVGFSIEGVATTTDKPFPYITDWRAVTPGYFETVGMQLIKGRAFTPRDEPRSTHRWRSSTRPWRAFISRTRTRSASAFDVDFPVFASDTDRSDQPEPKESASSGGEAQQVNIFFVGNSRAWSFGVEHDAGEWVDWDRVDDNIYLINADGKWIDDEGNLSNVGFLAIEHDEGELRYILDSLEIGADEDDIHHFEDEDGETIYFRALEIALFEVPHSAIKPWYPEDTDEEE
jgi:hypothetical protein